MNAFDLPTSLTIGEVDHPIRCGWRAVMDIFSAFNDPELEQEDKTEVMLRIFFPRWREIPFRDYAQAVEKACAFIDCGYRRDEEQKRPRIVDWAQDAPLIIPEINKIANTDVRIDQNLHWWTFFGWYMAIEGGLFGTVLRIRQKKADHKKLDKWEEEFYRKNKHLVDIEKPLTAEEKKVQDYFDKWLT